MGWCYLDRFCAKVFSRFSRPQQIQMGDLIKTSKSTSDSFVPFDQEASITTNDEKCFTCSKGFFFCSNFHSYELFLSRKSYKLNIDTYFDVSWGRSTRTSPHIRCCRPRVRCNISFTRWNRCCLVPTNTCAQLKSSQDIEL